MRVSLCVPACREGTTYPPGFVDRDLLVEIAMLAESLGYDALMSNDITSTPMRIREVFPDPPAFYEPLVTFAYLAARTTRIRFTTGVLSISVRGDDIVLLARQAATIDALSGGRLTLGVGRGGFEEEFRQTHPDVRTRAHRGERTVEALEALHVLFRERRATFRGKHYSFEDVESFPKPVQDPLPVWIAGRVDETFDRIGRLANGWLNSGITPGDVAHARTRINEAAARAGRASEHFDVCALFWVALGETRGEAQAVAEASGEALRFGRLDQPTQIIGTPDDVLARLRPLAQAGCDEVSVVLQARSRTELVQLIGTFAERVGAPLRN